LDSLSTPLTCPVLLRDMHFNKVVFHVVNTTT
jgi:hypothetical protein